MTRRRGKARRGRPPKANAKRRATTTAARRPEIDPGTEELRQHRILVTSLAELPDDLLGALYGRGVIDSKHYLAGRELAILVRLVRLGLGLTEASAAGAWRTILAATGRGHLMFDVTYPGTEQARRALSRFRRGMGTDAWRATSAAVDNVWPAANLAGFIVDLRGGLAYLAPRLPLGMTSI